MINRVYPQWPYIYAVRSSRMGHLVQQFREQLLQPSVLRQSPQPRFSSSHYAQAAQHGCCVDMQANSPHAMLCSHHY